MIKGIPASHGYAIGHAFILEEHEVDIEEVLKGTVEEELVEFARVLKQAGEELDVITEKARTNMGDEEAQVFESHKMMLEDPEFTEMVKTKIREEQLPISKAVEVTRDHFVTIFESLDNEYMQARAADIKDISKRLIHISLGILAGFDAIPNDAIILAKDLTPSDTAQLDVSKVKAFITEVGSKTSHSAIMARSMGIPAVLGVENVLGQIEAGTVLVVDGFSGEIILNPEEAVKADYEKKIETYVAHMKSLEQYKDASLAYKDGRPIKVAGNMGSLDDLEFLAKQGAHGVGLFRTEFLFMGRDTMPSEDEQYEVYKKAAESFPSYPVVIRTLDIGGDKVIPYMNMPKEDNPFLGVRALRLCMKEKEMFKTQLKALLRAGVYGPIHIMFPMISAMEELMEAKAILEECKEELKAQGVAYSDTLPVGMMIEIPAAAVHSRAFAKEVDFFSIGTNDLVQYTLAVDRMNTGVAHLYNPFHPAVLELIRMTIQNAHEAGIWCGMCGEMASDEEATKILASYGLDEFSVTGSAILSVKEQLILLEDIDRTDA